jgi:hypothetical protein
MTPIENQIFRLIFPPSGSIPLEKLEAVPHIRQHINAIIDLASTEHGISSPGESAALTARVIELRDTPGPDGKVRTWRTIAEICGTTLDAVRHRYGKGKATIRKSRTVEEARVEPFLADTVVSRHPKIETESLPEVELANPEKPPEQEKKPDEVATIREFRTVEKPAPLDPETLTEVDRMLGEGMGVLDIAAELEKKGKLVPWTKIRARAAYLARTKSKLKKAQPEQPEEEPQEAETTDDRPEPVSISRKELDLRIWDMWKAGETLDGISDILYSEGLYYSAKSVRVRLLSQGAKL